MAIILFDSDCLFCNKTVRWLIRHDEKQHFHFAPLSSDYGRAVIKKAAISPTVDSVLFVDEADCVFVESDAVLQIVRRLPHVWRAFTIGRFIPKRLRDGLYRIVAQNRHLLIRSNESCEILSPEEQKRFLSS